MFYQTRAIQCAAMIVDDRKVDFCPFLTSFSHFVAKVEGLEKNTNSQHFTLNEVFVIAYLHIVQNPICCTQCAIIQ